MASTGQTSTHAMQAVHRSTTVAGRRGAGRNARSGHVTMQTPHAVHVLMMSMAVTLIACTPGA